MTYIFHLERFLKLYTGLAMTYGVLHVSSRKNVTIPPEWVCGVVVAAPLLWPAYLAADSIRLFHHHRRSKPRVPSSQPVDDWDLPMSDDS
jgi:hypothetical protein